MKVELVYFKESGKYYATGELEVPDDITNLDLHAKVVEHMRTGTLPGLTEGSRFDTYYVGVQFEVPHIVRVPREEPKFDVTTLKPDAVNLLKIGGNLSERDIRDFAEALGRQPNLPPTILLSANFEVEHQSLEGYYFLGKSRALNAGAYTADLANGDEIEGLYFGKPGEKVVEIFSAFRNREGDKIFDYTPEGEQLIIKLNEMLKE